jgi:phosphate transport system ATP-binding protein
MTETLLNVSTQPQNIFQPHIEIENLNLWYGEKQALYNISIRISKNSVTALIDP